MRGENFCSLTGWNGLKVGRYQKVIIGKTFQLSCLMLFEYWSKNAKISGSKFQQVFDLNLNLLSEMIFSIKSWNIKLNINNICNLIKPHQASNLIKKLITHELYVFISI
jgi:hypothetical protein